jgi:E3 ubiquitin-protein ligase TRIP12
MLDSRIIDMSFNKVFLKLVIGEGVPLDIETLKVPILCGDVSFMH